MRADCGGAGGGLSLSARFLTLTSGCALVRRRRRFGGYIGRQMHRQREGGGGGDDVCVHIHVCLCHARECTLRETER